MQNKRNRGFVFWAALTMALLSGQACSGEKSQVTLPPGTEMVITLGKDGNVQVLDQNGKPAPKCQLCTKELENSLGPYCKDATAANNVCAGLSGVTVQDSTTMTIINTHKNPCYKCTTIGGYTYCLVVSCK